EVESLASSVADNGGVYFVPAFSGLYAPYWDLTAHGTVVGLTHFSRRAHLVRATLEAICYQTKDVVGTMIEESGHEVGEMRADGGGTRNAFLMQLQSDILGRTVKVSTNLESTCLGAVYLAGVAVRFWPDLPSLRGQWKAAAVYQPEWTEERREASYRGWKTAVAKTRYNG
ncbi:MAG: FGGY-family carbohydrate kinase, partial [Bacteroidota bacterium]